MKIPSASRWQRFTACAPSGHLPVSYEESGDAATKGTIIHKFIETSRKTGSRERALKAVPDDLKPLCYAISLDDVPASAESEVVLVYFGQYQRLNEVPKGTMRDDCLIMVADLFDYDKDTDAVYVADWKTGRGFVPAAENNWQMKIGALLGARVVGASKAHVSIIRIDDAGNLHEDKAEFDEFDLCDIEEQMLATLKAGYASERAMGNGKLPVVTEGQHCKYCPSFLFCPAKRALVRAAVGNPEETVKTLEKELLRENYTEAYLGLRRLADASKALWKALFSRAQEEPIPIGDGMVWGPSVVTTEKIDGDIAYRVINEIGQQAQIPGFAEKAVGFTCSKASITRAVASVEGAKDLGSSQAAVVRRLIDSIREEGGVEVKTTERYAERKA